MAWSESLDRQLVAVQNGATLPVSQPSPRVLGACVEIDPIDIMQNQIMQLVAYDEADPFIGMEYWREVRRNWDAEGVSGQKFHNFLASAARIVLAEQSEGNIQYYEDLEIYRTLRRWGFYA